MGYQCKYIWINLTIWGLESKNDSISANAEVAIAQSEFESDNDR